MDRCAVLQSQVDRLTCADTSTRWHSQAPDEPTRAAFATQSATHFDLASSNSTAIETSASKSNSTEADTSKPHTHRRSPGVLLQLVYVTASSQALRPGDGQSAPREVGRGASARAVATIRSGVPTVLQTASPDPAICHLNCGFPANPGLSARPCPSYVRAPARPDG
jgi:hypothetical protein